MENEIRTNVSSGNICAYVIKNGRICTADCNPCFTEGENVWSISRVFVPDQYRGKGIGKMLLDKMAEEVKNAGGKEIIVYPGGYSVDGERQKNFYKKNEFVETLIEGKLKRIL